jgi:hypothetical protein
MSGFVHSVCMLTTRKVASSRRSMCP